MRCCSNSIHVDKNIFIMAQEIAEISNFLQIIQIQNRINSDDQINLQFDEYQITQQSSIYLQN